MRLHEVLRLVGFALGGEGGTRLPWRLGMRTSPSTLLRYAVRGSPEATHSPPYAVGIDDFSFRRGYRYGTMIVDLERHEVIDLLEDREAGSVTVWPKRRPRIRIIAGDRGGAYTEDATKGTPQAMQVADRWHLIHNLAAALKKFLPQKRRLLREAEKLDEWLEEADASETVVMRHSAKGLRKDLSAARGVYGEMEQRPRGGVRLQAQAHKALDVR